MGSARGSGVVKSGLGNSGGWGRGPSVFGLLLKKGQCLENYMFIMQALLNFENIAYMLCQSRLDKSSCGVSHIGVWLSFGMIVPMHKVKPIFFVLALPLELS